MIEYQIISKKQFSMAVIKIDNDVFFCVINMNARLYDPEIAAFLSPDNEITFPENSQNYNRYSYALNNPLIYTDPSGNNPLLIFSLVISGLQALKTAVETGQRYGTSLGIQSFRFNK